MPTKLFCPHHRLRMKMLTGPIGLSQLKTLFSRTKTGGRIVHTRPPILPFRSVGQALSRRSNLNLSQSSTSSSTHPTRFGPRFTRLGNAPTFSNLATCCGEYSTNSRSWRFDSILITISPRMKSIAMPRLRQYLGKITITGRIPSDYPYQRWRSKCP